MVTEAHAALAQWTADASATKACPRCEGKQYHHGFGEHGHDPDWCEECGGAGFVAEFSEIEQMQRALDAAASVRAEVGTEGMEILRVVAAIPLWRDKFPDSTADIIAKLGAAHFGLTPDIVRQARAIVAAAERKEVMPDRMDDASRQHDATSNPTHLATPPTTGPIPEAGAPMYEIVERRLGSRHPGKPCADPGTLECAIWECQVADRCRKLDPSPQPPAPEGAPDVAGLIARLQNDGASWAQSLFNEAAAALAAKEAEVASLNEQVDASRKGIRSATGAMVLLDDEHKERIATLEVALRRIKVSRSWARARDIARAALAGKGPQQP